MSLPLKEMRQRISNKYTVLPMLYTYSYLNNSERTPCIFYEIEEDDSINDTNAYEVENTLITLFGSDDFKAFNAIIPFCKNDDELNKIHSNITEHWRAKVKAYLTDYIQGEEFIKHGYFFMFLPKSL